MQENKKTKPRCYKCVQWQSNMPMTGICKLGFRKGIKSKDGSRVICSHDFMPNDGCSKFELLEAG